MSRKSTCPILSDIWILLQVLSQFLWESSFVNEHTRLCKMSGLDEFPEVQVDQKKPAMQQQLACTECLLCTTHCAIHSTYNAPNGSANCYCCSEKQALLHYITEPRKVMSHIQGHQLTNNRNEDYTCALSHSTAWLLTALFASGKLHIREISN